MKLKVQKTIKIIGPKDLPPKFVNNYGEGVINTCSHADDWCQGLSPFILGPCGLYRHYASRTMENAWQYAKVYNGQTSDAHEVDYFEGDESDSAMPGPTEDYFKWAKAGWANPRAVRYPMGRGAKPLYSFWGGRAYGYVAARQEIYIPLYVRAVRLTDAFDQLRELHKKHHLILWDWDGYDHTLHGMTLGDVVRCPTKKMGHAFVLKMMLLHGPDFTIEDLR